MEGKPKSTTDLEKLEKNEQIKKAAEALVDDVMQANLLLPQVYSAINLYGASAYMRAAMEGIEPNIVEDYLSDHRGEFGKKVAEYATRAHSARGVSLKKFPENTESRNEFMFGLLAGHASSGRQCLLQYFEELEKYSGYDPDGDSQLSFDFLEKLKETLQSTELREDIRMYNEKVAEAKVNRHEAGRVFRRKWFELSMRAGAFNVLEQSLKGTIDSEKFFDIVTNPSQVM